jgi:hypothetical protein
MAAATRPAAGDATNRSKSFGQGPYRVWLSLRAASAASWGVQGSAMAAPAARIAFQTAL